MGPSKTAPKAAPRTAAPAKPIKPQRAVITLNVAVTFDPTKANERKLAQAARAIVSDALNVDPPQGWADLGAPAAKVTVPAPKKG